MTTSPLELFEPALSPCHHTAHAMFQPGDGPRVIAADLSCLACGTAPQLVRVVGEPGRRRALSHCSHCSATTTLRLTDAQSYALWTMPRGDIFIDFATDSL